MGISINRNQNGRQRSRSRHDRSQRSALWGAPSGGAPAAFPVRPSPGSVLRSSSARQSSVASAQLPEPRGTPRPEAPPMRRNRTVPSTAEPFRVPGSWNGVLCIPLVHAVSRSCPLPDARSAPDTGVIGAIADCAVWHKSWSCSGVGSAVARNRLECGDNALAEYKLSATLTSHQLTQVVRGILS